MSHLDSLRAPAVVRYAGKCAGSLENIMSERSVVGQIDLRTCRCGNVRHIIPLEHLDDFAFAGEFSIEFLTQFENEFAGRSGINGSRIVGIFIVESDSVQAVFLHDVGENSGELLDLVIRQVRDADPFVVAQNVQNHLDSGILQRLDIGRLRSHHRSQLVVEENAGITIRVFLDIRSEKLYEIDEFLAAHLVRQCVERIGVVDLVIHLDQRCFVAVGPRYLSRFFRLCLHVGIFHVFVAGCKHCTRGKEQSRNK